MAIDRVDITRPDLGRLYEIGGTLMGVVGPSSAPISIYFGPAYDTDPWEIKARVQQHRRDLTQRRLNWDNEQCMEEED